MKLLFIILTFLNWYYIPLETPSAPAEVESVDVNLKRDELAMTFFSLSDGEAALIQHGNGKNILINTGGENTTVELDRLLSLFQVKSISSLILTSQNEIANVDYVLQKYNVKRIVTSEQIYQKLVKKNFPVELQWEKWDIGDRQELLPGMVAKVVYNGNDHSEGTDVSFEFFHHRILYITSASPKSEQRFLTQPLQDVNIVKLPAFAKKGSFSELLIEHLDPQLAIIYKSKDIKPDPDLVEVLQEAWIDVYFTKQHGTITIKLTDTNYDVIRIVNKE